MEVYKKNRKTLVIKTGDKEVVVSLRKRSNHRKLKLLLNKKKRLSN